VAEARKNNWAMVVAVTDAAGDLVYFEKMDGVMTGSVAVAQGKACSAAIFKRPTKVWQDIVAGGGDGLRILTLQGAVAIEGGLPLIVDGKIVGAIGLSGGSAPSERAMREGGSGCLRSVLCAGRSGEWEAGGFQRGILRL